MWPVYFLLTSGWCPVKVKLWATPLLFHAKELDRPQNQQPLRRRNRPSYYKHNHAYYHATMSLVLSSLKAYICWIKVLPSAPLTASSISLFGLLFSATLWFLSHLLQITICWCWPGNLGCKAARPVPAVGSAMVAMVCLPQGRWGVTASMAMSCAEQWEKEASTNKVERGWVCHSCAWSMEAVRGDNMKLSRQVTAGCIQLSGLKEINIV